MHVFHNAMSRVLLSAILAGSLCTACVPPTPPDTEVLEFGVEIRGTLGGGENRTFLLPVETDVRYAISLVGTAGTLGVPDLRAEVRGQTFPGNIVWDVRGLSLFRPEVVKGFRALKDGVLEFHLENRTEGLTLQQGFLGLLLGDAALAQYRIRAYELGPDDHGRTPTEATRLADDGEPVLGTIVFGNDLTTSFSGSRTAVSTSLFSRCPAKPSSPPASSTSSTSSTSKLRHRGAYSFGSTR